MNVPITLLLIDDDPDDLEILITAIHEIDRSAVCHTARDGNEGLDKLKDEQLTPTLIFLDLNMPGMNGIQFLQEIKGSDTLKNIRIVVFSTSSNPSDIKATEGLGIYKYITKPASFSILLDTLRGLFKSL
ncbi:MAG TPA: response regulator [Ohtaekwangia sp.]|nr:response regulator [Ohtaekwangia sp.]